MTTTRRSLLLGASAAAFAPTVAWADTGERLNPRSIAIGDVGPNSGTFWARGRRQGTLVVQLASNPEFTGARELRGAVASAATDFTAKLRVTDLPEGQRSYWRATIDHAGDRAEWMVGSFLTAGADRDVRFAWGGDTGGQGFGIDDSRGGMTIFDAIRQQKPDFLMHLGDLVYSDQPFPEKISLPSGGTWRNLVTPETAKVSETLAELQGRFRYNHIDDNFRQMLTEVPILHTWDDHEAKNNRFPGMTFRDSRYQTSSVDVLNCRARRAFFEYTPIVGSKIYRKVPYGPLLDVFLLDTRSYRGPNSQNEQAHYGPASEWLGPCQRDWLKRELRASTATWKIIGCDMPLGIRSGGEKRKSDNATNGDGPPLGRELEIANILRDLKANGVRNTVWLTADLHYATATRYHPDNAKYKDFLPFWEFMAGPLNAGTGVLHKLDDTFGATTEWASIPAGLERHLPPSEGKQYYGVVEIAAKTAVMTVRFYDAAGREIHQQSIEPGT